MEKSNLYKFAVTSKQEISLNADQVLLLKMIGLLDFVNINQIQLLWSVIQKHPAEVSSTILSRWTNSVRILNIIQISSSLMPDSYYSKPLTHVYVLSTKTQKWLQEQSILSFQGNLGKHFINSHNEQAVETIVQALYTATFGSQALHFHKPYFATKGKYIYSALSLKGAILKGEKVKKGEQLKRVNRSAKTKVKIKIVPKKGEKPKDATAVLLSSVSKAMHPYERQLSTSIDYIAVLTDIMSDLITDGLDYSAISNWLHLEIDIGTTRMTMFGECLRPKSFKDSTIPTNSNGSSSKPSSNVMPDNLTGYDASEGSTQHNALLNSYQNNYYSYYQMHVKNTIKPTIKYISSILQRNLISLSLLNCLLFSLPYSLSISLRNLLPNYLLLPNYIFCLALLNSNNNGRIITDAQSQLLSILGNKSGDDNKQANNKKPPKPIHESSDFNYLYPNDTQLISVSLNNFCSLPQQIDSFSSLPNNCAIALIAIAIANIKINQQYMLDHKSADYNASLHLTKLLRKSRTDNKELLRDRFLVANPSFDIQDYDFRSFDQQFGYSFAKEKDLPFVADEMISFNRNGRRHEVFLELDNRTESNQTQVQKITNYIWYALHNPDRDVDMIVAITDGSLPSRKVKKYNNLGRKLGNLVSLFMRTYISSKSSSKSFIRKYYEQAKNLHIYLTGVSEAHIDIASILLGANPLSDQILTARKLATTLSRKTNYNVYFLPSEATNSLMHDPELLFNSEADLSQRYLNNTNTKGIMRYSSSTISDPDTIGYLVFKDRLTGRTVKQNVLFGDEHELDTVINIYQQLNQKATALDQQVTMPIIIYPKRERATTAITIPEMANITYTDSYDPSSPYLVQPRYSDNLSDHKLIRWIITQYSKELTNYFSIGAINKASLKKGVHYGDEYFKLLHPNAYFHMRTYSQLHDLVASLSRTNKNKTISNKTIQTDFANQLRIDEVPIKLIETLEKRWPQRMYWQPRFMPLPYEDILSKDYQPIKDKYPLLKTISGINSAIPKLRKQPFN